MARPGFHHRLRTHLASDNFDDKINGFLDQHAPLVVKGCTVIYSERSSRASVRADSKYAGGSSGAKEVVEDVEYSPEAHDTWSSYLELIENHLEILKDAEGLDPVEFKQAIEEVGEQHPMLIRLIIQSWDFTQFYCLCKEHVESMSSGNAYGGGCDEEAGDKAPSRSGSGDKEEDWVKDSK